MISTLTAALNQGSLRVVVGLFRSGWLQTECEALGVKTFVMPLEGPSPEQAAATILVFQLVSKTLARVRPMIGKPGVDVRKIQDEIRKAAGVVVEK